jgi:uncharacterized membrane protein
MIMPGDRRMPTHVERPTVGELAPSKETGRLEAFSDGVFAIAITLLALELHVPTLSGSQPTAAALWSALAHQWPSYVSFVTSFFTVLIMWVNHHGIFRLIRRTDGRLLFANGFMLMLVTIVPVPTALIATYLRTPAASAACAIYAGLFVVIACSYAALLLAARHGNGHLLEPHAQPEINRRLRDCYAVGVPVYLTAALVAPLWPWLTIAICTAMWVFWSLSRRTRTTGFER